MALSATNNMVKKGIARTQRFRIPSWRWTLVNVVLFSLCFSLVTRFHSDVSSATSVRCLSPNSVRQHMDRDAVPWTAPVPRYATLDAPNFHPYVPPTDLPLLISLLEQNLYNRPPPAC